MQQKIYIHEWIYPPLFQFRHCSLSGNWQGVWCWLSSSGYWCFPAQTAAGVHSHTSNLPLCPFPLTNKLLLEHASENVRILNCKSTSNGHMVHMQTKNMLMTVSDLHQINEFSSLPLGNSYTELVTSVHWRLRSSTELAICFQSSSSSPSSLAPKRTSSWRTGFLAVEKKELRKLSYMSFTILNLQFLK